MDKMKCETGDGVVRNVERIAAMFPQVVTEVKGEDGKITRAVKWDVLKELLSGEYVEGGECYDFTWPGKRAAIAEAARPIRKTLRPCVEESKDWDTTENLYIEGDNLEVLKLLQESYLGKVKMIYIDPPYNTGNDFVYRDDFKVGSGEYAEATGELFENEETGEKTRMFRNTEANGRFHSDWCSMIYTRLVLARDLLSEDGVIFISIDDNEAENLKKLCNEVFGEENFVAQVVWEKMYTTKNDSRTISESHEYVLIYAKNSSSMGIQLLPRTREMDARYSNPDNDPRGSWKPIPLYAKGERKNGRYPIVSPTTGKEHWPDPDSHWLYRQEDTLAMIADNRIYFGKDGNAKPNVKRFLSEVQQGAKVKTLWKHDEVGSNDSAKRELRELYGEKQIPFDFPKPTTLINRMLTIAGSGDCIVLDFFSGSATTAHAVMQLNAEDGGKRKFIMVQLPEECPPDSVAEKAGYANICEIGKERIRRAGEKIKEEAGLTAANLDIGFRVFKVADSNMKDVYYSAAEYSQDMIDTLVTNIKEDRTDLDLLYGCLLEWGVELSLPHTSEKIDGVTVHTVNGGDLIACFDPNIPESAIRTIAKRQPLRAVFRDSSFASAPQKINVEEIFKLLSPTTTIKVI